MNRILVYINLQTKGFILGYCLYVLMFILSFTAIVSNSIYNKVQIENDLIEIERQKCIELTLYSYFMNDLSEDTFSITEGDYTIDYNSYTKKNKLYLDAKITSINNDYTIRYIYNKENNWIEDIVYIK